MTTIASTPTASRAGSARITRVIRLHFVNPWTTIGVPWLVLTAIFLVNLAIWGIIAANTSGSDRADVSNGLQYSGASFYIFVYMLIVALQAITATFPFALGFSVTRRDFYLGTTLTFLLLSVVYGIALTLLSYLEQLTGGWGLGGRMFTAVYFGDGPWFARLFVFTVGLLFFFMIGTAFATVWMRWRSTGLLVMTAILVACALAFVAVVTFGGQWGSVGRSFLDAGPTGVAAWLLVPSALIGLCGFFVLRGATPRT